MSTWGGKCTNWNLLGGLDRNAVKTTVDGIHASTFALEALAFFFLFFWGAEKRSKAERIAPGRENATCPAGHGCRGQSLRLKCVPWMNLPPPLCRPSVGIVFQAPRREDFRKKTSSYWESSWPFFFYNDGTKQEISVFKGDVKAQAPPPSPPKWKTPTSTKTKMLHKAMLIMQKRFQHSFFFFFFSFFLD